MRISSKVRVRLMILSWLCKRLNDHKLMHMKMRGHDCLSVANTFSYICVVVVCIIIVHHYSPIHIPWWHQYGMCSECAEFKIRIRTLFHRMMGKDIVFRVARLWNWCALWIYQTSHVLYAHVYSWSAITWDNMTYLLYTHKWEGSCIWHLTQLVDKSIY